MMVMMVVMTLVMMVSARICGLQINAKSQRKNAKRMTTLPKIAKKHATCVMMMVMMVMMVVMTLVMMVSARICGMQRNAKSQRKNAKRMTTLQKIANKHADCAMMMMMMVVMMVDVKNWRNTDARHARCWSAANARCANTDTPK